MVKKNFKNMPILKEYLETLKQLGCNVAKNNKNRLVICYIYDTTYNLQHDTTFTLEIIHDALKGFKIESGLINFLSDT